jgi:hypothetical protein
MNQRGIHHEPLFHRFARRLTADGDPAPAGGGSPPAPAVVPPAGDGGAAPAPTVEAPAKPGDLNPAPASEPKSLLSDAKPEPIPVETEEQKAERLKNETPEEKTAREKVEADKAEADKGARAEAIKPYDALTLPEGMLADQPAFVDFKNTALDLGIEPEKAQKLIDTVAPKMKEAAEAPYNLWADTQEKWVSEIKADPVIGGANMEKALAVAARAIETYGTPELRTALAFTGAGNNPAVIRWMHKVGLTLGEGKPVEAKSAPTPKAPLATRMYGT